MNIPETLAWAIRLQDRTDIERFATVEPEIKIQPFNGWHFQKCHDLFGADYPGRIPGELVAHAVYLNSEPGDLVIDPMVGSGTTLDVCLVMGRHCYGYDLVNAFGRPDVLLHDFVERGWPERTVQAKLIFWDPPYYKKKDAEYTDESISRFSRDDYLQVFDRAARTIPPKFSGRLAFLCSDYDDEEDPNENVFFEDYIAIFKAAGWKRGRRTQAPLSPQQVHPDIVNKFRLSKGQARISRDLIMFHHE